MPNAGGLPPGQHCGKGGDDVSVTRGKQAGVGPRKGSRIRGLKRLWNGLQCVGSQAEIRLHLAPPGPQMWHLHERSYRRWLGRPGDRVRGSPEAGAAGGRAHPFPYSGSTHNTSGPSWTTKERRFSTAQPLTDTSASCTQSYGLTSPCISWMGKLKSRGQKGPIQDPPAKVGNAAVSQLSLQSPTLLPTRLTW